MIICPGAAWGTGSGAVVGIELTVAGDVVEDAEELEDVEVDILAAEGGAVVVAAAPQPGISPLICSSNQP